MRDQSIVRIHLSVFCSTQTCSPSAPVFGASEAAPGLFGLWPVQPPTKSGKRPVKDSVAYGARPLGRSATTAIDCSGLPLTLLSFACLIARPQQIGPLGSGRIGSDPLGSPSLDRPPSARPLCIGRLCSALLCSAPLGSPSSNRTPSPWAPHRIGVLGSLSSYRAPGLEPPPALCVSGPRLDSAGGCSAAPSLCRSASPLCPARHRLCSKPAGDPPLPVRRTVLPAFGSSEPS